MFNHTKVIIPNDGCQGEGGGINVQVQVKAVRLLFHERREMKQHSRTVPSDSEGLRYPVRCALQSLWAGDCRVLEIFFRLQRIKIIYATAKVSS